MKYIDDKGGRSARDAVCDALPVNHMKSYSAYFEHLGAQSPENKQDYAWWEVVMHQLLQHCDSFQLECRKADDAGLRSCARMGIEGRAEFQIDGRNEIWRGPVDDRFAQEFAEDAFDVRGSVKWSSVLLRKSGKTMLALTKNGQEIGVHGLDEEELEFLASAFHGHNFSFFFWEASGNGQLTHFQPIYGGDSEISALFEAYHKGKKPSAPKPTK